tara:strand:+ start:512 stop:1420 length:909 start_codon:yes stop_codon:yes gene_type:complete
MNKQEQATEFVKKAIEYVQSNKEKLQGLGGALRKIGKDDCKATFEKIQKQNSRIQDPTLSSFYDGVLLLHDYMPDKAEELWPKKDLEKLYNSDIETEIEEKEEIETTSYGLEHVDELIDIINGGWENIQEGIAASHMLKFKRKIEDIPRNKYYINFTTASNVFPSTGEHIQEKEGHDLIAKILTEIQYSFRIRQTNQFTQFHLLSSIASLPWRIKPVIERFMNKFGNIHIGFKPNYNDIIVEKTPRTSFFNIVTPVVFLWRIEFGDVKNKMKINKPVLKSKRIIFDEGLDKIKYVNEIKLNS